MVGSPYWMAPEVLRGEIYNEKVRLFTSSPEVLCRALLRLVLPMVCSICSPGVHLEGRNWASLW